MQSNTRNTFLERLAVARLQHTVNELQTQVDLDRTLLPPIRKIYYCVCDETALTASIPELKRFIADKTINMIVPFSTLDSLDRLKKGTEDANIHARESIRFFDRMQTPTGRKQITGVKIQPPAEKYVNWAECLKAAETAAAARSPTTSPVHFEEPDQDPPYRIQELLNCTIYCLNNIQPRGESQVLLVTNDEIVREWAELYRVPTVGSADVMGLVQREDIEFAEKKRHYDYACMNPRSPSSPVRGGRGGARGGRGAGMASGRRNSWKEEEPDTNFNGFGRGRNGREYSSPDYVLRGPPRGVARGRGKLWEP